MIKYLSKSENSIALIFCIGILSFTVPYGFPLFGFAVLFFICMKLISGNLKVRINPGSIILFSLIIFYFLGMFWSSGTIYSNNISEIINIASFLLIWILLSDLDRDDFPTLVNKIAKYVTVLCFPISLFSIYKLILYINGSYIDSLFYENLYPSGSSLTIDYNMFSLGIFAGLIFSLMLMKNSHKFSHKLFYFTTFLTCSISIFFTGSRRGWVIVALIAVVLLFILLKNLVSKLKKFRLTKFSLITSYFLVLFVVLSYFFNFSIDTNILNSEEIERLKWRLESISSASSFTGRSERWDYADTLINDKNPLQLFFGSGFTYLEKYAEEFNAVSGEDYPHNPILSTVLYSGLIGLLTLFFFYTCVVIWSIKNRHIFGFYFFLYYLIIWLFSFISGNSIFDNKLLILVTLIILAAPIKVREKETKQNLAQTPTVST